MPTGAELTKVKAQPPQEADASSYLKPVDVGSGG